MKNVTTRVLLIIIIMLAISVGIAIKYIKQDNESTNSSAEALKEYANSINSSTNSSVEALKEYANSINSIYYPAFDTTYTDIRFKLTDVSGDSQPELLAVGINSGDIEYIEVFNYSDGIVSSILNYHCGGANGGFCYPVVYNEKHYILSESYSSATGFYQALMQYNGTKWVDVHSSYTEFDYDNSGEVTGYVINEKRVSEQEYNVHRDKIENCYMRTSDFVKSSDL